MTGPTLCSTSCDTIAKGQRPKAKKTPGGEA